MPELNKTATTTPRIEPERAQFRSLLISNPNYFGNLDIADFKPVKKINFNTTYEELKCVGLYPEFDLLEAVVYTYKESGYGGGICVKGTPEYVRFYLSYDNGATWEDQGVTSFNAQDIASKKPLEYAVQLKINPKKKFCTFENLPKVRAILSWNLEPPANTPGYIPIWGNVKNGTVQIDTFKFWLNLPAAELLKDNAIISLLKENNLIPKSLTAAEVQTLNLQEFKNDIAEGLQKQSDQELSVSELHNLYKGQRIGGERYLYPAIQKLAAPSKALKLDVALGDLSKKNYFPGLDINIADIIGKLVNTDGNTGYEEMGCVGLDITTDNLEATIKVKKPYGYLGNLCKKGSREYVAFWMDFGAGWEYVGTTSVRVHDIASIPDDGLDYAVTLPVNLTGRRKPCQQGAQTARVRAIMSWETAPPAANPNWVPTWGNREETTVLITPGPVVLPDTHPAFIETIGAMAVDDIDGAGLASGAAVTAGFSASDSPFGGEIILTGHLAYPTDIEGGVAPDATPLEYKVQVSNDNGASWQTVGNSFSLHRSQLLNGIWSSLPVIPQSAPGGWYTYQEDLTGGPGNPQIFVVGNILARWQTNATMDGTWKVRIQSRVQGGMTVWTSNTETVKVDNVAPSVNLDITSGGGACADFASGTPIAGTYSAFDDHFASFSLALVPASGGTFTVDPNPVGGATFSGAVNSGSIARNVGGTGEAGTWSLDTAGLPQCGYVIYLHSYDRTIVDSGYVGHYAPDVVGLCIRE